MIDLSNAPEWFYPVQTKAGKEREAAFNLEKQGAAVFAPFQKNNRYYTSNPKYRTLPAFPRYIFAAFKLEEFYKRFCNTRGVTGLVRFGDEFGRVERDVLQILIDYSTNDLIDFSFYDNSPAFRYAVGQILRVTFGEWMDGLVEIKALGEQSGEYLVKPFVAPVQNEFNHLNLTAFLSRKMKERHLEPIVA